MFSTLKKLILIPVLTICAGLGFSLPEEKPDSAVGVYPEHLTGAFTGGFGETSCHSCHFDYDLNWDEGRIKLAGLPATIESGQTYTIQVSVERKNIGKAGFQMSVRYPDGSQAGEFLIDKNSRVMFTKQAPDSLQYVQHTSTGTEPSTKGKAQWDISWKAPNPIAGPVIINVASNAANGDQSEFGDWIYIEEIVVKD